MDTGNARVLYIHLETIVIHKFSCPYTSSVSPTHTSSLTCSAYSPPEWVKCGSRRAPFVERGPVHGHGEVKVGVNVNVSVMMVKVKVRTMLNAMVRVGVR